MILGHVPSLTVPGRLYAISTPGPGCECTRFVCSKRGAKGCTHLTIYKAVARVVVACAEQHGGDGLHACQACIINLLAWSTRKVRRDYVAKTKLTKSKRRKKQ